MGEDARVAGYVHYIMSSFLGALFVTSERVVAFAVQTFVTQPYATCGFGSPGAMKLVSGLPVSLAALHLAIVGELYTH